MTHQEVLDRWPILQPWFAGFPEELHKAYTVRELPEQYLIHQKGSPLERVGVLCDGGLRVVNEFNTGNIFQIEHTAPVDIIGDVTLLARQDRVSVTIETLVPSTILFFTRADFECWMERDSHLVREMAANVANKLYHASLDRGKELFYSSPRLLMEYLLRQSHQMPLPCKIGATRQEISETLGLSLLTVDRTVNKLRQQDLISLERGKICLSQSQRDQIACRLKQWLD